jgi:hypothetical protein
MTDLQARFRTLDELHAPELWREAERRAAIAQPRAIRANPWVLITVLVLLALVAGAAALIGSHIVRLGTVVDASSMPSTSANLATPAPTLVATAATWTPTASMREARSNHTATLLSDGRVLVAGGFNASTKLASAELYDPRSGSWTATGSMLEARSDHTATRLADGRVLVVSGADVASGGSSFDQHAELYDPETGTWSATGELRFLSSGRRLTATLLADGRVLLMSSLYDPETGTWRPTKGMAEQGHAYAATRLTDGTVLVAGGGGGTVVVDGEPKGQALASAQLLDPVTRTWTATGSLREPRAYGVATLLLDGTVLIAGGLGTGLFDPLLSSELFDPASGSWTATANVITPRGRRGTFTLLQDGTVLAAGGSGAPAAAELYDPVSRTWAATASMDEGRVDQTATLLADGTVLVVGGASDADAAGNPIPTASGEVYHPASGN